MKFTAEEIFFPVYYYSHLLAFKMHTYHQVSNDHDQHKNNKAHGLTGDLHAIPHGLYPLSTQHTEHDQKGVKEVMHVPAGKFTITGDLADTFFVALTKELHADHGKNEDNDGQHQGEISQSPHGIANDLNQHI